MAAGLTYLIIGGAGYIGSHTVKEALAAGHRVVILDDLSLGHEQAVAGAELVIGDFGEKSHLDRLFQTNKIDCVIHFAAKSLVGPSMADPLKTYNHNLAKTLVLLQAMAEHEVGRFILSSTAAVYGEPNLEAINESAPLAPINPYGRSKLFLEQILADCRAAFGLDYAALRYFNAAGADESGRIGEDHCPETHLIPLVLQTALGQRAGLEVFGTDYDTPDGTCIRDYVHVTDLARAHLLAGEKLKEQGGGLVCNLGSAAGYSVKEVIETAVKITGLEIPFKEAPRRSGDPARLKADSSLAKKELGWAPEFDDLERIITTAWLWHSNNPQGFA